MAYTALARRYRSQSFDDVVGQEPIAQTLKNAIATDRLHHAYLFTGTRGVGKTSMARIFARALNAPDTVEGCPKPKKVEFPPIDVQQRMADAIMRGEDLNVIEIDAASNTGVDNVRDIIANANLAPTSHARFKIYIIDEVHMLSKAAFNALLKVMEEPPSHVKFILATTEVHKVLPTILSRCQRFDFRNIPTAQIVEHLRAVLKGEKVKADDDVLFQIARLGNGSMRDALSLLDRLLAAADDKLTGDVLERMLGVPDRAVIAGLVDAIAAGDPGAALTRTDELLKKGIAQDQLITVLIEHLRSLMILSAIGPGGDAASLVEMDETSRGQAAEQAAKFDTAALVHMMALLENVGRAGKSSATPRALLDAAVVRLALSEQFADLAAILSGAGSAEKKKIVATVSVPSAPPSFPRPAAAAPPPPGARLQLTLPGRPAPTAPRPAPPLANPVAVSIFKPSANPPAKPAAGLSPDERDDILRQPFVQQVMREFDATVVDIRAAAPPPKAAPDAAAVVDEAADETLPPPSDEGTE